jgi:hypothetical protein
MSRLREYRVISAQYYTAGDDEPHDIPGVPGYYKPDGIGKYRSAFPSHAASKAYSALIKYMRRYKNSGPTGDLFADVDFDNPPVMIVLIEDVSSGVSKAYQVWRVVAPQSETGPRVVVNQRGLRVGTQRVYRWRNMVKMLKISDVAQVAQDTQ